MLDSVGAVTTVVSDTKIMFSAIDVNRPARITTTSGTSASPARSAVMTTPIGACNSLPGSAPARTSGGPHDLVQAPFVLVRGLRFFEARSRQVVDHNRCTSRGVSFPLGAMIVHARDARVTAT